MTEMHRPGSAALQEPLGWEDFLSLPEDGNRYEILDGQLVVTPPPALRHQRVSRNLQFLLHSYIVANDAGELFDAPVAVRLSATTIVEPDLAFVATDHAATLEELSITGPPELVVEILSPSTARRDRRAKAELYARLGVPWYWIVDPTERTLEEFSLEDGAYALRLAARGPENFEPGVLPGLTLDLSQVWA